MPWPPSESLTGIDRTDGFSGAELPNFGDCLAGTAFTSCVPIFPPSIFSITKGRGASPMGINGRNLIGATGFPTTPIFFAVKDGALMDAPVQEDLCGDGSFESANDDSELRASWENSLWSALASTDGSGVEGLGNVSTDAFFTSLDDVIAAAGVDGDGLSGLGCKEEELGIVAADISCGGVIGQSGQGMAGDANSGATSICKGGVKLRSGRVAVSNSSFPSSNSESCIDEDSKTDSLTTAKDFRESCGARGGVGSLPPSRVDAD